MLEKINSGFRFTEADMYGAALTGRSIGYEDKGFQGSLDLEEFLGAIGRKKVNLMSCAADDQELSRTWHKSKRGRKSKYQVMLEAEDDDEQADEEEYQRLLQ